MIPQVPEEDFLEEALRVRDERMGKLFEQGLPELPKPEMHGIDQSKPGAQLGIGGAVRPRVNMHISLPARKDQ
jgi:hypothetical protein